MNSGDKDLTSLPVEDDTLLEETVVVAALSRGKPAATHVEESDPLLDETVKVETVSPVARTTPDEAVAYELPGRAVAEKDVPVKPVEREELLAENTVATRTPTDDLYSVGGLNGEQLLDEEDLQAIPPVTEQIKSVRPLSAPNIEALIRQSKSRYYTPFWSALNRDYWLIAVIVLSCLASAASTVYFFKVRQILTYGDSYSHMLIARRVIDSLTPGLAQFGGVWLPLPHILMLPFIWHNYLWNTGLAGSFVAMPCYVVAAVYLFLTARRLTGNDQASFVGTLLFILNPNVLYLQATPLSELVLIVTMSMACYHFLAWAQTESPRQLIVAAVGVFLATMSRYDGWFLFLLLLVCMVVIGLMKRHKLAKIEGNVIIYGSLGGLGIILWLIWCWAIFGDPLYWQRGPFSSQAQQMALLKENILFTYHNLWESIRYFMLDASANVGPGLFLLGLIAIVTYYIRRRVTVEMVVSLSLLVPFLFYVVSLYNGQAAIYVPDAVPASAPNALYNARYGVQAVPPIAIFLATLIHRVSGVHWRAIAGQQLSRLRRFLRRSRAALGFAFFLPIIIGQVLWTANTGVISLQSGLYGLECAPQHDTITYISLHYDGGKILEDTFTSPTPMINFRNVIYEGSNVLWVRALADPAEHVDWIIVNPRNKNDLVAHAIDVNDPQFMARFTLLVTERQGLRLYRRSDLPPAPRNDALAAILVNHSECGSGGPYRQHSLKTAGS